MNKLAALAALAVLAAMPATAVAKRIQHVGGIVGDSDSEIRLRVTKKGGEVRKLSGFKATGALVRCTSGDYALSFAITGPVSVNRKGKFKARVPSTTNPNEKLRVSGQVKGGGKKVKGNLKTNELTRDGERCTVPKQRFKTSRR